MRDFHTHSTYSDGAFLPGMVRAAEDAGLDGIGITDHCNVSERDRMRRERARYGFHLDLTYERRREAVEDLRADADVEIYDAVEMDYDPRDEAEIDEFLDEAGFDYAIGSVHELDERNVQMTSAFADESDAKLDALVDRYYEKLVSLIESGLFEVAAHIDLVERTPPLRGRATEDHYRRVAEAFADSRTIPEINAGRALRETPIVHPNDDFLETLREHDVPFTIGTDAHEPSGVIDRVEFFEEFLAERGVDTVAPPGLDR